MFLLDLLDGEQTRIWAAFQADYSVRSSKPYEMRADSRIPQDRFSIEKTPRGYQVAASTPRGFAWGLRSTVDGVVNAQESYSCVLLDVARRYHSPSTLRSLIRAASVARVKSIQLHLTDDQNWMFPSRVLPGIEKRNQHRRPTYTVEELKSLQEFAFERGVELIPEIDLPGHSSLLVATYPETFAIKSSPSRSCIDFSNPAAIEKIRLLIREVMTVFDRSKHIHLGGDEAYYPGLEKQVPDVEKAFLGFLSAMIKEVRNYGKTPIVWEGFHRSPASAAFGKENPNLIVVAWEGSYYSPTKLLEDGFRIVNAGWDPFYVVGHYPNDNFTMASPARIGQFDARWFRHVVPFDSDKREVFLGDSKQILGSMLCWWEGHEWDALRFLPERIIAYGLAAGGDRSLSKNEALRRIWWRSCFPFEQMNTQVELADHPSLTSRPGQVLRVRGTDGSEVLTDRWNPATEGRWEIQAGTGGSWKPIGETIWITTRRSQKVESLTKGCRVTGPQGSPEFPLSRIVDGEVRDRMSYWLAYPSPQDAVIDLGRLTVIKELRLYSFWDGSASSRYQISFGKPGEWKTVVDAAKNTTIATAAGYRHKIVETQSRYIKLTVLGGTKFPPSSSRIVELQAF